MVDAREEWFHERQSVWLYGQLARMERVPARRALFDELGRAANEQAGLWERRLGAQVPPVSSFRPTLRARVAVALARQLGPQRVKPMLAALKVRGLSVYESDLARTPHRMPLDPAEVGARHRSIAGGTLRAAVFGVNDGLVSNASLILGMAGAGAQPDTLLASGVAGLLAGALSMAAGEYVSVRSQRELFERQIALERAELAAYPREEAAELALIYEARGLSAEHARELAGRVITDPERALATLAREELGLDPESLDSPWAAAGASFAAFALGAVVPLLPYCLPRGAGRLDPLGLAVTIVIAALFGVGAAISLFTGRSASWSGVRMVAIGSAAGAATWLVGKLLGVVTS
jgi:VIT1/CCC1 family predicted Fe2+/Mn2+ transporter